MSVPAISPGANRCPRNRGSAEALVNWITEHKTRFAIGTAFHIREDVYRLASEFLQKPDKGTYDVWWLEMVQKLSITISDDDFMAALPNCGWKEYGGGAWRPPEDV